MASYWQKFSYICDGCSHHGEVAVLLVADLEADPRFAGPVANGSFRRLVCEQCEGSLPLKPSLLVRRASLEPPLLFAPDPGETEDNTRAQLQFSLVVLQHGDEKLAFVPMDLLPIAVNRDIMSDLQQRRSGTLPALDPEMQRYTGWLDGIIGQEHWSRVREAVFQFGQAVEPARFRTLFETWPELTGDDADVLFTSMVQETSKESLKASEPVRRRRILMRRVRDEGIDAVLPAGGN